MITTGGGAFGGSLSVGKTIRLYGATSGVTSIAAPSTAGTFTMTLPASLPSVDNQILVSSTTGDLSWKSTFTTNNITRVNIGNNQATFADVVSIVFPSPQFSQYVLITVNATTSLRALYLLEGVQQPSGTWDLNVTRNGSVDPGINFALTNTGQLQYKSGNNSGWTSTTLDFYNSTVNPSTTFVDALTISNTTDATSATSGAALQVAGGLAVGKKFIRKVDYNPQIGLSGTVATTANTWITVTLTSLSAVAWLPTVSGITVSSTYITVPMTGLYSLSASAAGGATIVGLKIYVRDSAVGNGQTAAVTGNSNVNLNVLAQNTSSNSECNVQCTVLLNGGTNVSFAIVNTVASTQPVQIMATLLQYLS